MANFVTCNTKGMSLEAILKSVSVVHDNGQKGYRFAITAVTECDDLNDAPSCGNPNDVEAHFRESIVVDECGKAAIRVFNTIAAT